MDYCSRLKESVDSGARDVIQKQCILYPGTDMYLDKL